MIDNIEVYACNETETAGGCGSTRDLALVNYKQTNTHTHLPKASSKSTNRDNVGTGRHTAFDFALEQSFILSPEKGRIISPSHRV